MLPNKSYKKYQQELDELLLKSGMRILPESVPSSMLNLSSNDYLGLMKDDTLKQGFLKEHHQSKWKFASSSSRLLTGNSDPYKRLESQISEAFGREACLMYNSGYHANIGILPALTSKKDLIVADKLIHASLIDGIRLSQAEFKRFTHLDYEQLEEILKANCDRYEHVFIVCESIYSMDGDCSDLQKLVALKKKYNAFLYIDEAHAIGVRGDKGLGLCEEQHFITDIDFIVGTFGKALASYGAYIVCDDIIKQYLVNTSRSLIFTTALPPINIEWTQFIFSQLGDFNALRQKIKILSKSMADAFDSKSTTHIIPYILGENETAIRCSQFMCNNGFYVLPIRYPSVPLGAARLRFSLTADINVSTISDIATCLKSFISAL
jgi:8-amino-7-oxononanoate synthase